MDYERPNCPFVMQAPHFQELDDQIAATIKDFGGKAFAKLNWSSPKVKTDGILL